MKKPPAFGSKAHTEFLRKAREAMAEPDPLDADPFYILGQLKHCLTAPNVSGLSRSPTQRVRDARAILEKWEAAKERQRAAGKTFFLKAL
jgi:hypothetical protein